MSKDGPPISGGYRYGSLNALRAKLPAKAVSPRGAVTEADSQARRTLADFAAYPARTKGIGKPLPNTQGISSRRAAALQRIRELEQRNQERSVTLHDGQYTKLKLVFDGGRRLFYILEEDFLLGYARRSFSFSSRDRAMLYYRLNRILWTKDRFPLP
jgi:hypothetical protein